MQLIVNIINTQHMIFIFMDDITEIAYLNFKIVIEYKKD